MSFVILKDGAPVAYFGTYDEACEALARIYRMRRFTRFDATLRYGVTDSMANRRMFSRLFLASLAIAIGATQLFAGSQANASDQPGSLVTGQLTMVGAVVLVLMGIIVVAERVFDRRANAWAADDNSTFGRHRRDADAHVQMREKLSTDFKQQLEKLREEMRASSERQHEAMMSVLAQNTRLLELVGPQMRRTPHVEKET